MPRLSSQRPQRHPDRTLSATLQWCATATGRADRLGPPRGCEGQVQSAPSGKTRSSSKSGESSLSPASLDISLAGALPMGARSARSKLLHIGKEVSTLTAPVVKLVETWPSASVARRVAVYLVGEGASEHLPRCSVLGVRWRSTVSHCCSPRLMEVVQACASKYSCFSRAASHGALPPHPPSRV